MNLFAKPCKDQHPKIMLGTCPWCGFHVVKGSVTSARRQATKIVRRVMSYCLKPRDGLPFLDPHEVVDRLCDSFPYVEGDANAGANSIRVRIAFLLRCKTSYERRGKDRPKNAAKIDHWIERLEAVRSQAVKVVVADENAYFSFVVIPDENISIHGDHVVHMQLATPLVLRAADTLNYIAESR